MAERTEEDVIAGVLRIAVGGTVKAVPTLKWDHILEWTDLLDTLTAGKAKRSDDKGITALADVTNGAYLQLVLAYDRTGALGGREWLQANADPAQLSSAVEQMADNAIPFGAGGAKQVGLALGALLARTLAPLVPPSSQNGASRNGTSDRKKSGRAMTPNR